MIDNKIFFRISLILVMFLCVSYCSAQNFDINLLRDINIHRNKSLDHAFETITNTAIPISIATPVLIYSVGLIKNDSLTKKQAIYIGETFLASAFVTIALKDIIKRNRPYVTYPEIEPHSAEGSYSMPSGHTSSVFATATALSIAYPKWYIIAPSFAWASTVGYSRMHLGVHYPTDVLVGAIIGSGSALLTHKINKWLNKKKYN